MKLKIRNLYGLELQFYAPVCACGLAIVVPLIDACKRRREMQIKRLSGDGLQILVTVF